MLTNSIQNSFTYPLFEGFDRCELAVQAQFIQNQSVRFAQITRYKPGHDLSDTGTQHETLTAHSNREIVIIRTTPVQDRSSVRRHGVYASPCSPYFKIGKPGIEIYHSGCHQRKEFGPFIDIGTGDRRIRRYAENDLTCIVLIEVVIGVPTKKSPKQRP